MTKALVLLSGGLDSTTALAIALDKGRECQPVSFNYGQRHARELESAQRVVEHYRGIAAKVRPLHLVDMPSLYNPIRAQYPSNGSALTYHASVPRGRDESVMAEEIPITYVPGRNSVFLAIGYAIAEMYDMDEVWVGFNAVDYSGYPDCRPEFADAMETALNLGSKKAATLRGRISLEAPIIRYTKEGIIRTAMQLHAPIGLTWSCYVGGAMPCGECDSCRIRGSAFRLIGEKDPAS